MLFAVVGFAGVGCGGEEEAQPDARAGVGDAASMTLAAGPAGFHVSMSSSTAELSARGAIEAARDRFFGRARIERAPSQRSERAIRVAGTNGETYEVIRRGRLGSLPTRGSGPKCWYDPAALVGSAGGGASVQEALTLVSVVIRLLRDGVQTATVVEDGTRGKAATTYRVDLDPESATMAPGSRRSEAARFGMPRSLARHLAPALVRVGANGLIRNVSLQLRNFAPALPGPRAIRGERRERVAITVSLNDFGRRLKLDRPTCRVIA